MFNSTNLNKTLVLLLLGIWIISPVYSQVKRKKPKNLGDNFENTQWWLGFKAGGNLTQAVPKERYSTFSSSSNADPALYNKDYEDFHQLGANAGLEITVFHKGFSFSFQPNYRRQRFFYSNDYLWTDSENSDNTLILRYEQDHQLDYLEFPVSVKYDITRTKIRPSVFLGYYYATLINANKSLTITGTDLASGGANSFEYDQIIVGAKDLFIKSSMGVLGGVGGSYDVGNLRISLDVTYRYGLNNISNVKNRFINNRLAGAGDALDDIKLRNITFNLAVLFPMRFLGTGFKAVN